MKITQFPSFVILSLPWLHLSRATVSESCRNEGNDNVCINEIQPEKLSHGERVWKDEEYLWEYGYLTELIDVLGCGRLDGTTNLEIYDDSVWEQLRDAYIQFVGEDVATIQAGNPQENAQHGFRVPVEVKITEEKGRTIFAKEPIEKNSLVWSTEYTATFFSSSSYRLFLRSLPINLTCDVFQWAYCRGSTRSNESESGEVSGIDVDISYEICVDLDIGSLLNDGRGSGDSNIGMKEVNTEENGCNYELHASRDIEAGEEIIVNYVDFGSGLGWGKLGL